MTIEQLAEFDAIINSKLQWDEKNVDQVLRRILDLKIKVLGKFTQTVDEYKDLENQRSKLHGERFKWYNESSPRKYDSRKDIDDMINQEVDYFEICRKVNRSKIVCDHLEKMMKFISDTEWDIRNWLDVKKMLKEYGSF